MPAKTVNHCGRVLLLLMFLGMAMAVEAQPEKKPAGAIEVLGQVVPYEQVNLYTRITGFADDVSVDIGDRVKKGQRLVKIFAPELAQSLAKQKVLARKAEIGVKQAKQAVAILDAALERSKAEMDEARAGALVRLAELNRWQAAYERASKLEKQGALDKQAIDEARNQLKSAQAALDQANAKIKAAEAAVKEAAARREHGATGVELAQANLDLASLAVTSAEAVLDYAEVRAPFDGVVTMRTIHTGHFLRPPQGDKPEPLFTIARVDRMRVLVDVPERDAARIEVGAQAIIRLAARPEQVFKGTVARTAASFDPETAAMRVEIDLPNPDGKTYGGAVARVTLMPKNAEPKKK